MLPLLSALALAADIVVLDDEHELPIRHCHAGDLALVHVEPIPLAPNRVEGWMFTTNSALRLDDLSMLPLGTNRLSIQTVCHGVTSAVAVITVSVRRPLPPPRVAVRPKYPRAPVLPPSPPGMVAKIVMPLPGGKNETYGEFKKRLKDAQEKGRRRGQ